MLKEYVVTRFDDLNNEVITSEACGGIVETTNFKNGKYKNKYLPMTLDEYIKKYTITISSYDLGFK